MACTHAKSGGAPGQQQQRSGGPASCTATARSSQTDEHKSLMHEVLGEGDGHRQGPSGPGRPSMSCGNLMTLLENKYKIKSNLNYELATARQTKVKLLVEKVKTVTGPASTVT